LEKLKIEGIEGRRARLSIRNHPFSGSRNRNSPRDPYIVLPAPAFHLSGDRLRRGDRISGFKYRPSNDDVINASGDCARRSHHPLLIIAVGFDRANPRRNDNETTTTGRANVGHFMGRSDDTIHSRFLCQQRQSDDLVSDSTIDPDALEVILVQAGQNRNR
jgi:hypothetical protein